MSGISRIRKKAEQTKADLYIAHDLVVLPVAINAARKNGGLVGFDIEDFYSRMNPESDPRMEKIEKLHLPQCDYVTASTPLIAELYEKKYQISRPTTILNVFPISHRPKTFRPTQTHEPLKLYWFSQTIGEKRGLEDAIKAMGLLRNEKVELHLRGVWQKNYKHKLFLLAKTHTVDPTRIISHDPVSPDEMIKVAAEYDIGLATEHPEQKCENRDLALSNKLFTYLLAGNAIIATKTTGQNRLMSDLGSVDFTYMPNDIASLAGQIKKWHGDREALNTIRRNAWDCGTRRYNWDIKKKIFLQIIDKCLADKF